MRNVVNVRKGDDPASVDEYKGQDLRAWSMHTLILATQPVPQDDAELEV